MSRSYGASILTLLLVVATASGSQAGTASRAAAASGRSAPASLWTRVTPPYAMAPAEVRVEVVVEPSEDNRALDIVIDSAEYYRGSSIPLDGARAARFHSVNYRGVPAGAYTVLVRLRAREGVQQALQREFLIVPR